MPADPAAASLRVPQLRWWREVLYVVGFYVAYTLVRNQFGSAAVGAELAYRNAATVIDAERALRLFVEQPIQQLFLGWDWFLKAWNIYYGTAHFIVTAFALGFLYRRDKRRHPLWRNTIFATSLIALAGFTLFPLMPPRLLNAPPPLGGAPFAREQYGFVDTMAQLGGWWSFDTPAIQELSNQYAAMPSLHCAWAMWCALVMWPLVRRWWVKALVALYPLATVFCTVVTANHFWLDAVGGYATLLAGWLVALPLTRLVHHRVETAELDEAAERVVDPSADDDRAATASGAAARN